MGQPLSPILRVQEFKTKPVVEVRSMFREEYGRRKYLSGMVSANRVVASNWIAVSVVVGRTGHRCSVIEGILTCVIKSTGEH